MRYDLRKAGAWLTIVSMIFWCSCERHHVGELPNEQTTEAKAPADEHAPRSEQPTSHNAQTPAARNSPANFFPDKPKP